MKYFGVMLVGVSSLLLVNAASAATYYGVNFLDGEMSFADTVVDFAPGSGFTGTDDCTDASNLLGVADYGTGDCGGFVSLGFGGELVVQFTDNSLTTSGDYAADLYIFEICAIDLIDVAISKDNVTWVGVGSSIGQPLAIDIDAVFGVAAGSFYSYVRLTDVGPLFAALTRFVGADIDTIGAISSAPQVPLPPTGLLLSSGGLALVVLRRRKRVSG